MSIGALDSIIFEASAFHEKVAVRDPINHNCGAVAKTISQGRIHLTTKTAISIPQIKNHLLYLGFIVDSTSAFIIALSILDITSKRHSHNITINDATIFYL